MKEQRIVGITGGIGSGKSTISYFLEVIGFPVYNSDAEAKKIYYISEIKNQVIELLGDESYSNEGLINKKFIGEKIFSDKFLLQQLNRIIHPEVRNHFSKWCSIHAQFEYVFQESALLFQNHLDQYCYKSILVDAPEEIRINRVMMRDRISRSEVLQRIQQQGDSRIYYDKANLILINDNKALMIPQLLLWLKTTLNIKN